jgi:hypothetical protein
MYTIDISKWDSYKSSGAMFAFRGWKDNGFPLAIMRASYGLNQDPGLNLQREAAQDIPRLFYHYFYPNISAIAQSDFCWEVLHDDFKKTDYVAADFEFMSGLSGTYALTALKTFLSSMETHVPADRIFIYTGGPFWANAGGLTAEWAAKYRLWIAEWPWDNYFRYKIFPPYTWTPAQMAEKKGLIDSKAIIPLGYAPFYGKLAPWNRLPDIWQFTSRADPKQIAGYEANKKQVDFNAIYMDIGSPAPKICPCCGQVIPE